MYRNYEYVEVFIHVDSFLFTYSFLCVFTLAMSRKATATVLATKPITKIILITMINTMIKIIRILSNSIKYNLLIMLIRMTKKLDIQLKE